MVGGARGEEGGTTPAAAHSTHVVEGGLGPHPGLLSQGSCMLGGWSPPAWRDDLQSLGAGPAANVEAAHLPTCQTHPMYSPTAAQLPGTWATKG